VTKKRVVVSNLEDRSFEAYKKWIRGLLSGLFGEEEAKSRQVMTEEELRASWRRFWANADAEEEAER
jgi:hypothetical protein